MSEERVARGRPWIGRGSCAIAALFLWVSLLRFPVVGAQMTTEDGWKWGLGILLRRKAQIGADWIYTYGPLGFFMQRAYDEHLFVARFLFELAIKAAFVLVAFGVLRRVRPFALRALLYAVLVCLPAWDEDATYGILLLLCGLYLLRGEPCAAWKQAGIALVLAVLSLFKFPLLVLASGTVAVVAVERLLAGRRAASIAWMLGFPAGIVLLWTSLGQSPSNLPVYLLASVGMSRGYADAMSHGGPLLELAAALAVLALVASVSITRAPRTRIVRRTVLCALLLAAELILFFKEGFVRQDPYHSARFFALALPAVLLAPLALAELDWSALWRSALLLVAGLIAAATLWADLRAIPEGAEAWPDPWRNLSEGIRGLVRPSAMKAELEERLEARRKDGDLERIRALVHDAPIDVLGNFQLFAILSRLNWAPRCCFQSYAAYTDESAERNAAYFEGARAPRFVLADGRAIDRRYPSAEDGPAQLAVLWNYEPRAAELGFVLLERSPAPPPRSAPTVRQLLRPGEAWNLPATDRPLAARIRCRKSWRGSLASALLRSPTVILTAITADGARVQARILPSLERSTFLLSPFLGSADDWIDVYTAAGAPHRVARIRIDEDGSLGCFSGFEVEIDVLAALVPKTIDASRAAELHADLRAR